MTNELKSLIESSKRILITSHIGPDGDSISSSILLGKILELNYPDKKIVISMEERPVGLNFVAGIDQIEFQPLELALKSSSADLLIILDANAMHRVSRHPEEVEHFLASSGIGVAVIDHHEGMEIAEADIYINDHSPAVTLDIYDIFIDKLGLDKPEGYAQTTMTGIYTDTGGFVYRNLNFNRVFDVIPKLLADGADIEKLVNDLNTISEKSLAILTELLENTHLEDDYTYSFISDKTATKDNHEALVPAEDLYKAQFLRNIEGRSWGFLIYRDVLAEDSVYSVSFRAQTGAKDVSAIARALGGGGHKPAAGAKIECPSIEEALAKVKAAITSVKSA